MKLMLLIGLAGVLLIVAPLVVFSQVTGWGGKDEDRQPIWTSTVPGGPAALDDTGRMMVLARWQDDSVRRNLQTVPAGGLPSGWQGLDVTAVDKPIVVADAHGEMVGFVVSPNGEVFMRSPIAPVADERPAEWGSLDGHDFVDTPAVAQDFHGKLVVVARSGTGEVWSKHQLRPAGEEWSDWRRLPISAGSDPVIQRDHEGKLHVFALGSDHRMRTIAQLRQATDEWGDVQTLEGLDGRAASPPAVAADALARLHVFCVSERGTLWHSVEGSAGTNRWTRWEDLQGDLVGRPFAITGARNSVAVFGLSPSGTLQHLFQAGPHRSRWSEWQDLDGDLAELLTVTKDREQRLIVYGIGKRGELQQTYQVVPASAPWHDWTPQLGGSLHHD